MSIEKLLDCLDGIRASGNGKYSARCPAHDDRSPSLSIKECSDGRILLRCFAGCETEDVLSAIGLTFSDLFPEQMRTKEPSKPQRWLSAKDALASLDHEGLVVAIIGADFLDRREIDEETWARLATSVNRINGVRAEIARCKL